MRKITFLLILLVLSSTASGCSGGSYVIIKGDIETSDNGLTGAYDSFTGSYYKKVKFQKGDVIEFSFTKNELAGELCAVLLGPKNEVITEIEAEQTVVIEKTQSCKVQVEGQEHKGSFVLQWDVN